MSDLATLKITISLLLNNIEVYLHTDKIVKEKLKEFKNPTEDTVYELCKETMIDFIQKQYIHEDITGLLHKSLNLKISYYKDPDGFIKGYKINDAKIDKNQFTLII